MTPQLEQYLKLNRHLIEEEEYEVLYERCPLNARKELCLLLLECSDNDTSLFKKEHSTLVLEKGLQKYLPDVSLCYCWISFYKGTQAYHKLPNALRKGHIDYVAILNDEVICGRYQWGIAVDFLDINVIANKCSEGFARHIKENTNDK